MKINWYIYPDRGDYPGELLRKRDVAAVCEQCDERGYCDRCNGSGIVWGGLEVPPTEIRYDLFGEAWTFINRNTTLDVYTRWEALQLRAQLEELGAEITSTYIPYENVRGLDHNEERMV